MFPSAERARSNRDDFCEDINQRTMCEQNSTAIPTVITKFTRETALALILKAAIIPPIWTKIMKTTEMIMKAPQKFNPNMAVVTRNTAPNL